MPEMIIRAGTWGYRRNHLPAFRRSWVEDDSRSYVVGFRVACEVPPPGVLRGGSWNYHQNLLRASIRYRFDPDFRFNDYGFRIACEVEGRDE